VESGRALMEFGSKCDERSRLAVTRQLLVGNVPLKQGKGIPEEGVGGL
jgi:hypothetical protein